MSWIDDINKKLQEQRDSFKESVESGEALKRKRSYASSMVSDQTRSKAGKIGSKWGIKNLEKAKTTEHQSKAGKKGGMANVKSGHLDKIKDLGAAASKDKFSKLRSDKLQIIFDAMEPDVKYTLSQLKKLVDEAKISNILKCPEASNFLIRECKGQGATAFYIKRAI